MGKIIISICVLCSAFIGFYGNSEHSVFLGQSLFYLLMGAQIASGVSLTIRKFSALRRYSRLEKKIWWPYPRSHSQLV